MAMIEDRAVKLNANGLNKTLKEALEDGSLAPSVLDQTITVPEVKRDFFTINTSPNGFASTYIYNARFNTVTKSLNHSLITYSDSATLGGRFTVNSDCVVTITISGPYSSAASNVIVYKNQTASSVGDILINSNITAGQRYAVSGEFRLLASDVITIAYVGGTFTRDVEVITISAVSEVDTSVTVPLTQAGLIQEQDSVLRLLTSNGSGSTNTMIRRFTTIQESTGGSYFTYTDSATEGASITILSDGFYSLTYVDSLPSGSFWGISRNASGAELTSNYINLDPAKRLGMASTDNTDYPDSANWSGPLTAGTVLRPHYSGSHAGITQTRAAFTISRIGTLKQANVNPNQKATIESCEVVCKGASNRGTTDTAVVRFDTTSITGSKIVPITTTAEGTYFTVQAPGKLSVSANMYTGTGGYIYISKNQANKTAAQPTSAEHIAGAGSSNNSAPYISCSREIRVSQGDVIRVTASSVPVADNVNSVVLLWEADEVGVSVSNTLPQFSESDLVVKAENNAGTSITVDSTNIPFSSTLLDTTGGSWNGSQFTVPQTGIYSIAVHAAFTTNASRALHLYKNGAMYRRIGELSPTGATQTHNGFIQERFTAGEVLSIRANGTGGTLLASTLYHYIEINRVGKPNVTGVNVTPFVNIPRPEKAFARIRGINGRGSTDTFIAYYSGAVDYVGASGLFTVTSSATLGTVITVNRNGYMDINAIVAPNSTAARVGISKNHSTRTTYPSVEEDVTINDFRGMVASGDNVQVTASGIPVFTGDTIRVYCDNALTSGSRSNLLVSMEAESQNIVTPLETFSTDTTPLTYASSSQYTLATLANAPVGTYITFTYEASSNARTQTTTRPTQTDSDMSTNGFLLYSRIGYSSASTAAQPNVVSIQIGKGLKGVSVDGYAGATKINPCAYDLFPIGTTGEYGVYKTYDEKSGILTLDGGYLQGSSITSKYTGLDSANNLSRSSLYFVINASKNPALAGLGLSTVAARGRNSSGQTFASASEATLTYNATKDYDNTNSLNAATGVFTSPETAYYQVDAAILSASVAWSAGHNLQISIFVNGLRQSAVYKVIEAAISTYKGVEISDKVYLKKGDTCYIGIVLSRGVNTSLDATGNYNYFSITKVGV